MKCLLIDVGSSFIKYGIYDEFLEKMIAFFKIPFPSSKLCEGRFLVSREAIETNILNIFSMTEEYHCGKAFISVQMHGYLVNKNSVFSEYVSWRDRSGDVSQSRFEEMDFNQFGTSLKDNLPLVKIKDMDEIEEFYTLGSYLCFFLTGNNMTHITDACASGFFYVDSGKCNGFAGHMKMPEVCTGVKPAGYYKDILVYAPMGDHQISYLGSGAGEDGYLLNIGTAAQISCLDSSNGMSGAFEKRPYFSEEVRLYTVSGLLEDGGEENKNIFFEKLMKGFQSLPEKKRVVIGGGGSLHIREELERRFAKEHLDCSFVEENIGMEGLKRIARENKVKAGTMISEITFPNFPVIAKNCALDFVILDHEHGGFDFSAMGILIMNANLVGIDLVIRVGDASRGTITKLADMGAGGFLRPMTNDADEIRELVRYAKYTPVGKRGISTTRAHTMYNPPSLEEYKKNANERMKIYAQIETAAGVENIDQILAVEGVEGVFIGPNDLADDLGVRPGTEHVFRCMEKIARAAGKAQKPWGIITADKKLIRYAREWDVDMISSGSELNMLISGCKKIRETIS